MLGLADDEEIVQAYVCDVSRSGNNPCEVCVRMDVWAGKWIDVPIRNVHPKRIPRMRKPLSR